MTKTKKTPDEKMDHSQLASRVTSDEKVRVHPAFKLAVNMSAHMLNAWLATPESRSVGFKTPTDSESVGHRAGRRVVRLLTKREDQLTSGDLAHMRKVVGYIHRHVAQHPSGDITETPWRYSLMNWGHDPEHSPKK